jgi:predicted transposase YdaD
VEVIGADLSAVTSEADKVLRVAASAPWLAHVESQAGYDPRMPQRLLRYNALLDERHDCPVMSVLMLLRPEADGPALTGSLHRTLSVAPDYLDFRYGIIRVWEEPVERILAGGLATLPLAPLAKVRPSELPKVIRRMEERLRREASPGDAALLWTATYLLMGLRYSADQVQALLQGVRNMKESSTYQAILAEGRTEGFGEGREEEARTLLLRLGRKRFGPPGRRISAAIKGITDVQRIEQLTERLLDVKSWDELLDGDAQG